MALQVGLLPRGICLACGRRTNCRTKRAAESSSAVEMSISQALDGVSLWAWGGNALQVDRDRDGQSCIFGLTACHSNNMNHGAWNAYQSPYIVVLVFFDGNLCASMFVAQFHPIIGLSPVMKQEVLFSQRCPSSLTSWSPMSLSRPHHILLPFGSIKHIEKHCHMSH